MARLHFEYTDALPRGYGALLWDTFFTQRGRGVSLETHFPWIHRPAAGQAFATLKEGSTVLAGLTVRPCGPQTAAVGLVCVDQAHRGQGLSRMLLTQALARIDETGVAATTLWTGKPRVYESHGFLERDSSLLCEVTTLPAGDGPTPAASWPAAGDPAGRGLPPYAHHALRLGHHKAQAVMLMDTLGIAVAEWQGSDEDVIALLRPVMPRRWRLHALLGDTLPQALRSAGASLTTTPQRLQMWRPRPGQALPDLPALRLLDRI